MNRTENKIILECFGLVTKPKPKLVLRPTKPNQKSKLPEGVAPKPQNVEILVTKIGTVGILCG